jgi:hypothetical protein
LGSIRLPNYCRNLRLVVARLQRWGSVRARFPEVRARSDSHHFRRLAFAAKRATNS